MLLWETHMCYSEIQSPSLGYVNVLFEVIAEFIFTLEALIWKIIMLFVKGKNFMKCFCEKRTSIIPKWEVVICDMLHYC